MATVRQRVSTINDRVGLLFGRCFASCTSPKMTKMEDKELTVIHDKTDEPSKESKEIGLMVVTNNSGINFDVFEAAENFQNSKPPEDVIKWTWDPTIIDEIPDDFFQT